MSLLVSACGEELAVGRTAAKDVFEDARVVQLLKAATHVDGARARQEIDRGADVNALGNGGMTPLLWALGMHNLQAVALLLDLGARPDFYAIPTEGKRSLPPPSWVATATGQSDALKILLSHGANPNLVFGGKSLLIVAMQEDRLDCADLLLKRGADVNFSDGPMNVMFAAVSNHHFRAALWALNHGYRHDLQMAQRMLAGEVASPAEELAKQQALVIVANLLSSGAPK